MPLSAYPGGAAHSTIQALCVAWKLAVMVVQMVGALRGGHVHVLVRDGATALAVCDRTKGGRAQGHREPVPRSCQHSEMAKILQVILCGDARRL